MNGVPLAVRLPGIRFEVPGGGVHRYHHFGDELGVEIQVASASAGGRAALDDPRPTPDSGVVRVTEIDGTPADAGDVVTASRYETNPEGDALLLRVSATPAEGRQALDALWSQLTWGEREDGAQLGPVHLAEPHPRIQMLEAAWGYGASLNVSWFEPGATEEAAIEHLVTSAGAFSIDERRRRRRRDLACDADELVIVSHGEHWRFAVLRLEAPIFVQASPPTREEEPSAQDVWEALLCSARP